jgi:hypothetical protein
MTKYCFHLVFLVTVSCFCYSQDENEYPSSGFDEKDNTSYQKSYTEKEIRDYVLEIGKGTKSIPIGGLVASIFHEPVDSVRISLHIDNLLKDTILCYQGLFRMVVDEKDNGKKIRLNFIHPDYYPFDTSFICNTEKPVLLSIKLNPRFKISLRGRVYAGNMPLEGVRVEIRNKYHLYQMVTRGCFYDKDDYWNCLYDGMFKQDLTFDKPTDSVVILLNKEGMKPLSIAMPAKEFSGDILNVKMKYSSKLPVQSKNNLSLKLGFPFSSTENDWFIDLTYFRSLKIKSFNRLMGGFDVNMILTTVSVSHPTFPGLQESVSDSSYISGFAGPSLIFWLTPPENRYFSTYAGANAAFSLNKKGFAFQPYVGTLVFLDLNKAISIELRHVSYELDVVHYEFNPYGNAFRKAELKEFNEFLLNIGIQIVF